MDTTAIHLDLKTLALRGGESHEHTFAIEMAPIVLGGERYAVLVPGGVTVKVDRVAGGFLVGVALRASLYGPCDRCLREAVLEVAAEEQEFVPTSKDGWDENDLSPFIEDLVADVGGLAREATVLALPGQVVCTPDCLGLCTVCGKDLNEGPCSCKPDAVDDRLKILRDLKLGE